MKNTPSISALQYLLLRALLALSVVMSLFGRTGHNVYAANTILYAASGGISSGTCNSWLTACDLQYVLSVAASTDEIWVKQGLYKPTGSMDRTISFVLKSETSLYGGFVGTETQRNQRVPSSNLTILSGDIGVTGNVADNSYHVVVTSGTSSITVLDGFTVTKGNANNGNIAGANLGGGMYNVGGNLTLANMIFSFNSVGVGASWFGSYHGGGVYNENCDPTFTNVIIADNIASQTIGPPYYVSDGGGMYNLNSHPVLTNVTFSNNVTGYGGGMYNDHSIPALNNVIFDNNKSFLDGGGMYNKNSDTVMNNVVFSNNIAFSGGGVFNAESAPSLINVIFDGNQAVNYGGGGMVNSNSNATLTHVVFKNNRAHDLGGGLHNSGSNSILTDVTFSNNTAVYGGGMFNSNYSNSTGSNPILTNVTFSGNSASFTGGGLENRASHPILNNVTFNGNTASYIGGSVYNSYSSNLTASNTIFWMGGPQEIVNDIVAGVNTSVIKDSVISSGCPTGGTCINIITTDPNLGVLADNGGFTQTMALGLGSSAIDEGGKNSTCAVSDQRGATRPQGTGCDIGSYEAINAFLVNSVLPTSRSIPVGTPATIFNTVINAGTSTAHGVTLFMETPPEGNFSYQQTDCVTNTVIGSTNPILDLPAGGILCYVLIFTPNAPFAAKNIHIRAQADFVPATTLYPGINTWLLRATNIAGPDIIASATTADFHQVACSGTIAFAIALSNVGMAATGDITAAANTGTAALPLNISIMETDPGTGAIIGDNILQNVGAGENRTVGVFVTFSGCINFDPAVNRVFIEFKDASNNIVGSTSTAVSTNR